MQRLALMLALSMSALGCSSEEQAHDEDAQRNAPTVVANAEIPEEKSDLDRIAQGVFELHAQGELFEHRPTWPRSVPLQIQVSGDPVKVQHDLGVPGHLEAKFLDCHGDDIGWQSLYLYEFAQPGSWYDFINTPFTETFAIPVECFEGADKPILQLSLTLDEETATYPLDLPITYVDSIEMLIDSTPDAYVADMLADEMRGVALRPSGDHSLLLVLPADVPADMTLAFNVILEIDGSPVVTAPVVCGKQCRSHAIDNRRYFSLYLDTGDEPRLWDGRDMDVVLKIESDPALGLRDLDATCVWEGSLLVPLIYDWEGIWFYSDQQYWTRLP